MIMEMIVHEITLQILPFVLFMTGSTICPEA